METIELSSPGGLTVSGDESSVNHLGLIKPRLCLGTCGAEIPEARLRAAPNSRLCVSCLEAAGDVPLLRRFDQDGTEVYFTQNRTIEREIRNQNRRAGNLKDTESFENVSLGALNLPSAIREQGAALARSNSERMRTAAQEKKSRVA